MDYIEKLSKEFLDEIIRRDAKEKYHVQKSAVVNGKTDFNGDPVEFRLTFEEWFGIWMESGKWDKRGKKKGHYVMSRVNDIGHYEVGNVFIQLHADNIKQYRKAAKEDGRPVGRPKDPNGITPAERSRQWRLKQKQKKANP
ncbi:hypothetical protein [Burkholderia multivorans]|uniref:hypothetical protein n=1 Tax=Burkholderia TaxID=32008 RepID=UPI0011B49785|nr:hypothetical protein [Burkholderia multivorans]